MLFCSRTLIFATNISFPIVILKKIILRVSVWFKGSSFRRWLVVFVRVSWQETDILTLSNKKKEENLLLAKDRKTNTFETERGKERDSEVCRRNLKNTKLHAKNGKYLMHLTYSWPPLSPCQERWGNTAHTASWRSHRHLRSDTTPNLVTALPEFQTPKNMATWAKRWASDPLFFVSHGCHGDQFPPYTPWWHCFLLKVRIFT